MKQIVIDKYLFIIYIISRLFIIKNNKRVPVSWLVYLFGIQEGGSSTGLCFFVRFAG